ncbi:hypothetical protein [Nonomuraea sp. NPDC003804]|uniref:hypothetical protein n=1 Tax=Nonomuraea sp. NPDC003804 TaxID=3154547 RepID=UPI0033B3C9A4
MASLKRAVRGGLGAGALLTAVMGISLSPAAWADPADNKLTAGETLKPNQTVKSANGEYKLIQQTQGNLVLYGPGNEALWSSPTAGAPAYATMQREGNLVIYSDTNKPLWSTNTAGNPGAYLAVQNDGNLVIYSAANQALWSRQGYLGSLPSGHTLKAGQGVQSRNGEYRLIMQKEGNLVLYNRANKPLWTTPTADQAGSRAVMQKEGNLVIYNAANQAVWTTKTAGNPGAYLAVQNEGNVVIYTKDNKPLWSTR